MAFAFDFKKILSTGLKSLPKKFIHPATSVVGIDIGSAAIKVVQLRKERGKAVLETYGTLSLGPFADRQAGEVTNLPPEKIVEALKALFSEAGVTTKNAAVGIPAAAGLVFLIELPPQIKPSEFDKVVPTESRKFIPVPISEVNLDWFVIPQRETIYEEEEEEKKTPPRPTEILVAAVPKDILARLKEIASGAELADPLYEHEIFSSLRANLAHEVVPVLIIDFGAAKTKLAIIERGVVRVFHSINRGSADITNNISKSLEIPFAQAEEIKKNEGLLAKDKNIAGIINLGIDFILGETSNVVLNFEKKYNKSVSEVILTGGGSMLPGVSSKVKEVLKKDVFLSRAFAKTEAPAFLEKTLEKASPEFATAIGLALKKL